VIGGIALGIAEPGILCALVLIGAMIGGLIGLPVWFSSIGTKCPECGKWWAKRLVKIETISRKKAFGLVTRTSHSHSTGRISGTSGHEGTTHSSGSTSWQERVPVLRTTDLMHYGCKYCHASWTELKDKETEDFEIERPSSAEVARGSERVIERQILVIRCKYCGNMTAADLSQCQTCGGRM
jgi:hypothetical protein